MLEIAGEFFTAKNKQSDADFVCQFDSGQAAADTVQARGVAISFSGEIAYL